ncbi:MAG: hypothetical protein NC453_20800, partial [Muribaculum sp.]|nr:hypothetical protein [Muribaculum sp.]
MKKLFISMAAAAMCASAFAGTRILYEQNFETVTDPAAAGWSFGGASMSIASDEYGKFLELALGQNNGRSGQVTWGNEVFLNKDGESVLDGDTYNVSFDFSIKQNANNQFGSGLTLFTNHAPVGNQGYRLPWNPGGVWSNYVFDLSQCNTAADPDMIATINAPFKAETTTNDAGEEVTNYSIDTTEQYTLATGNWYTVSNTVNVVTREVEYKVEDLMGNMLTSGTMTVPQTNVNGEDISMFVEGLYVMESRYQTIIDIDNIKISFDSDGDYANPPTVALTRLGKTADEELNLNLRAYTISFLDGETLHVTGTDGQTVEVEWADCEGSYVYDTTVSGTITAWTTCGTATSEPVSVVADCVPCPLPSVSAAITSVQAGYGKTYTLNVSNADVPLQPTIFIDYKFVGKSGKVVEVEGVASGAQVVVDEEGVLSVTSTAFGYQATTATVDNNIEYVVKKEYDFARMSKEELAKAGFSTWDVLNSGATSGFNNWTARHRLFYNLAGSETVNEEGATVYTEVYPFGFIAEDNTTNVIEYSVIEAADNAAGSEHFEGLDVYVGHNLCAMYRVGVFNNETGGGNNKNIDIYNLDPTDVVIANKINNYGGNSNHPVVATDEEYYAQLEGENFVYLPQEDTEKVGEDIVGLGTYSVHVDVYRIDTTCAKLTIFAQAEGGAVEGVEAEVEGDNYYYTIDGLRLAEPTRPGLYIHNGKKI